MSCAQWAWAAGQELSLQQAIAEALADTPVPDPLPLSTLDNNIR